MSNSLDAKYEELRDELIAHAEKFPLGDLNRQQGWRIEFDRLRKDVKRLRFAKRMGPPPTAAAQPLPVR
jgi:hypothetical protein